MKNTTNIVLLVLFILTGIWCWVTVSTASVVVWTILLIFTALGFTGALGSILAYIKSKWVN